MLFRDLQVGQKFYWDDQLFTKTGECMARRQNGGELCFSNYFRVRLADEQVNRLYGDAKLRV